MLFCVPSIASIACISDCFGSSHGKGEHDGCGAIIKRALYNNQLPCPYKKLQNSNDAITWLASATQWGRVQLT